MNELKACIFDFDYTLVDSSEGIVLCYQGVLRAHGYTDTDTYRIKRTIGKTLEASFTELTGISDPDTLARWRKEYVVLADRYMTARTRLFPHTLPTLRTLKARGIKQAIVSTKYRYRIHQLLDQYLPADFFSTIVGGEDVTHMKPHPDGLLRCLDHLGVTPSEALYVGDSVVDALTAQAAQVPFAAVLTGITRPDEFAPYPHIALLDHLGHLPALCHSTPM